MREVTSIEQFQVMMQSEEKEGVLAVLEAINTSITPKDVRQMAEKTDVDPIGTWVGWR